MFERKRERGGYQKAISLSLALSLTTLYLSKKGGGGAESSNSQQTDQQ
jgi:hypothetical protein